MTEADSAAIFRRVERAEQDSTRAVSMIATAFERIRTLESRIATLEASAIVRVDETTS